MPQVKPYGEALGGDYQVPAIYVSHMDAHVTHT